MRLRQDRVHLPCGFVAIVLLAAFGGCPDRAAPPPASDKPFLGTEVKIAIPAGLGLRTAWESVINEWSAETGAAIELQEFDFSDPSKPFIPEMAAQHALLVFPIARRAELAEGGALAPIPDAQLSEANLNWLDLFHGLRDNVASWQEHPTIIPIAAPVLVCYYRSDLLTRAGLSPPRTWDDYQKLLEKLGDWAPGLTAVEPWSEEFRTTMYLARAASLAKHPGHFSLFFEIETGAPLIDGPGFTRALESARAALAKMPPEVLTYDPADCRAQILAGKAALAVAYETGPGNPELAFCPVSLAQNPVSLTQNTAKGDAASDSTGEKAARPQASAIGFCRLPGSTQTYNLSRGAWEPVADRGVNLVTLTAFGGVGAAVSARCSPLAGEAAWNLLSVLAGEQITANFPPGTRTPCRDSQSAAPAAWVAAEAGFGLRGAEIRAYLGTVAQSLGDTPVIAELSVIGRSDFRRALTKGLNKALSDEEKPDAVLGGVAKEWESIAKSIGLERVRDNYRKSLGLEPLTEQ